MKLFSFILSIVVFFVSLYFFVVALPVADSLNEIIYVALLAILMAICIVGIIINWDFFRRKKKNHTILFVSNGFSKANKK